MSGCITTSRVEDDRDFKSLHRFLTGRATGYVAAGGGGFGPAHIGVFKAFAERGVTFDMLGGTSVGAAMLGGFSLLMSPEELDRRTHDVFVVSRAFKRLTYPRYALLDHVPFDAALRRQFGDVAIEDAWRPYFAVATVLDGSGEGLHLMRRGPMWKAVRASGSLPAVLPPVLTDDGRMLVDGAVIDNIPLRLDEGAQGRAEPGRPFRRARNAAALRGGRCEHPGPLEPDAPDAHALRAPELAARCRARSASSSGVSSCTRRLNCCRSVRSISCSTVPALAGASFMDFDRHTAGVRGGLSVVPPTDR